LLPATGGKPHELFIATSHAWADDGSLFFLRRGAASGTMIGRVAVDRRTGFSAGPEEVVGVLTGCIRDLAVAPGSRALAVSAFEAGFNLTRLPLSADGSRPAGSEEVLSTGSVRDRYPDYSPDGQRLAYSTDRGGPEEVLVLDLKTLRQKRLPVPQDDMGTFYPHWLPDSNALVVQRFRIGGPSSMWLLSLDGSRAEQSLLPREPPIAGNGFKVSPDGQRILVPYRDGPDLQIYERNLVTGIERRLTTTPGNKYEAQWS
jgi:TolB protein